MNKPYRIAVIPGDGIGKEVMPEGLRVLDAVSKRFGIALEYQAHRMGKLRLLREARPDDAGRLESATATHAMRFCSARSAGPTRCPIISRCGVRC